LTFLIFNNLLDRVTFLASSAQVNDEEGIPSAEAEQAPSQGMSYQKPQAQAMKAEAVPSGELDYKDEAPFEDDLPF
jgi:hypothetical protein